MTENLVRDAFELLIVFAVGAMLVSAIARMRRGEVPVYRCAACGKAISRAYPSCPKCGAAQRKAR